MLEQSKNSKTERKHAEKIRCFKPTKTASLRATLSAKNDLEAVSHRLKALGHVVRLQILEVLAIEECCVCDLANVLEQPVSTLSQHLKTLKAVGLVQSRQSGKFVMYSLCHDAIAHTSESIVNFVQP